MYGIQNLAAPRRAQPLEGEVARPSTPHKVRVFFVALVLALTFLTYLDTLWFQFVHDDEYQILGNAFLRSWSFLPRYFSGNVWTFWRPELPGNYYRPLFLLWLRFNYVLFGTNPGGWHLTTVLTHVGATLSVYLLARRLVGDWVTALFAGLIFGLHPIHIEATAWVSGVPEPLLVLLLIPSYLVYLRAREGGSQPGCWLALSLGLYALAMLVKETALVLPLLIFSGRFIEPEAGELRGIKLGLRRCRGGLASAAPYLILTIPYLVARFFALQGLHNPLAALPVISIVSTWPSLLWLYLRHLFWPAGLCPFYDLTYVEDPGLHNVVLPAIPVALAALVLAWSAMRSHKVAQASAWLVLPILPVLNVQVFGNGQFAHDRYLYMPSVGFSILVALALRRLPGGRPAAQNFVGSPYLAGLRAAGRARLLGEPALQVAVVLVLACALGLSTTSQTIYYANHTTYYLHSSEAAPNNDAIKTNIAGLLSEAGHYAEAEKIYQEVLARNPDSGFVNYDLGYAYYRTGRLEEAEYYLTRATQLWPNWASTYFYLGLAQFQMGHFEDAALNLRRAVSITPYADNYHFALGRVLRMQGDLGGALAEFRAELAFNPDHAEARRQAAETENALRSRRTPATTP